MKQLVLLFVFLGCSTAFAQLNPKTKWGNVSQEEFDYNEVPYEKDAAAVILYESGDMTIARIDNQNKVYRRIKILKEEGKKYANQEIPYYDLYSFDEVRYIKAQSINLVDGKVVKTQLAKKDIYTSDVGGAKKLIRFAIPNVEVGTIIEYEFSYYGMNNYAFEPWEFQHQLPTLHSTFEINVQAAVDFVPICLGEKIVKFAKDNERKREFMNRWTLNDLSSTEKIEHVYNKVDAAEKILFQLKGYRDINFDYVNEISTWFDLKNKIIELDAKQKDNATLNQILDYISPGQDEIDQIEKIFAFMRKNYKWNEAYSPRALRTFKDIHSSKKGNSADLNLLLNQLLKRKNIRAELVLVSARENGRLKTIFPFAGQFTTYVNLITLKNGETLFVDAVHLPETDYNYMPLTNFNQFGLILDTGADRFVEMNPPLSEIHSVQNYTFKDNKFFYQKNEKRSGYFKGKLKELSNDWGTYRVQTQALDIFTKEIRSDLKEADENKFELERNIYESVSVGNQSFVLIENPLKYVISQFKLHEDERERPLEFNFPFYYKTDLIIDIPEGYALEIPDRFNTQQQAISKNLLYFQGVEQENGKIIVHIEFYMGKSVFDKDYQEIKSFFDKIILDSSKSLLLKKI